MILGFSLTSFSQLGYGLTATTDIYQRFTNPKENNNYGRSAGSFLLNFGVGPKIWIGGKNLSFSAEAMANIGLFGLGFKDFKGLGMASFPIIGKLNFNGLSGLDKEGKLGFHIGGGIQYSRTELYGLSDKYDDLGVQRKLFKTYIAQVGYGFGISGFALQGFGRYGWNKDSKANIFSIGLQYDFNLPMLKKITSKESSL